ncbi:MAG: tetratricopeptide repeat protein [Bacteroidales bacterium]|nr:tetratricopeptide repeat protein [Bacteroidales bacterium]MBR6465622.1 tetratricopeptide repeat protein [Bacteroidales bacterium]
MAIKVQDKKDILSRIISAVEVEALMREGRNEEAHSSLSALLKKEPKNSYAWYLLGNLYSRQKLFPQALDAYRNAKLLEPDGPAAAAVDWVVEQMSSES